jgi:hypothetical protein
MNIKHLAMALPLIVLAGVASADPDHQPKAGIYQGEVALMGNGLVRSWTDIGVGGKPNAIGVTFTDLALDGLPGDGESEFLVNLPKQAKWNTPYDHIAVDWNPHGHPPPGVYDVPHFDFHFYMITPEERSKITAVGADLLRCDKAVPAGQLPPDYFMAIGTEVPNMGVHCLDGTSPELHGAPFTSTFIYGAYNGRVIFNEPMVALSSILARADIILPIRSPAVVLEDGYYPTVYAVTYNWTRQETTVQLREFVWRKGKNHHWH